MKVGYHISPKDACQSCISGNRRWLLWVVGTVGYTAVQLTAFASVGCRTIVVSQLLMGFSSGFEEFKKHHEGNKKAFWQCRKIDPKGPLKGNVDCM